MRAFQWTYEAIDKLEQMLILIAHQSGGASAMAGTIIELHQAMEGLRNVDQRISHPLG